MWYDKQKQVDSIKILAFYELVELYHFKLAENSNQQKQRNLNEQGHPTRNCQHFYAK